MKEIENALYTMMEKAKKYDDLVKLNIKPILHCSFCGKDQNNVKKLVAGKDVYICNECVEICNEIIADSSKESV